MEPVKFNIEKVKVTAPSRQLDVAWSVNAVPEMVSESSRGFVCEYSQEVLDNQEYGLEDTETIEIVKQAFIEEIRKEIDNEIIQMIVSEHRQGLVNDYDHAMKIVEPSKGQK